MMQKDTSGFVHFDKKQMDSSSEPCKRENIENYQSAIPASKVQTVSLIHHPEIGEHHPSKQEDIKILIKKP